VPSKTRDGVSLRVAVDAFMSSTRCANPNTRRAYGTVLDTLLTDLDPDRALTGISGDELAEVVEGTWGGAAPATWNRNRAALSSFLAWCAKNRYPAPVLPPGLERRVEHPDETRALPRAAIERQLSPPVPSKTRDGVSLRVAVDAFMSSSWRSAAYRSLDASLQRHLAAPLGAAPAEQPLTAPRPGERDKIIAVAQDRLGNQGCGADRRRKILRSI